MKYTSNVQEQNGTLKLINPNAVQEGDLIEAHFPNGEIERGIAVREAKTAGYRGKRRMMLCEEGARCGHIITGCAGFPDGTQFFKIVLGDDDESI